MFPPNRLIAYFLEVVSVDVVWSFRCDFTLIK